MLILSFVIAYWAGFLLARPLDNTLLFLGRVQEGAQGERLLVDQGADWQQLSKLINQLIQRCEDYELHLEEQVKSKTALLQRQAEHLQAVSEVGRQMAAVLDTHDLLQFVTALLRGTFHYDLVGIFLIEDESLILKAFASRWNSAVENKVEFKLSVTKCPQILQETIRDGIPRINLGQGFTMISNEEYRIQSEVVVAIKKGERVLGALIAQSCLKEAFHEDDLAILTALTAQIAVTLENARLFAAEKQLRELAVLTERNRMAQEIHDTLAQGFLGILLMLRAADPLLEKDPSRARPLLQQAQGLAEVSLEEARRSVWNLRPKTLEGKTLVEAFTELIQSLQRENPTRISLQCQDTPYPLPPSVEPVIYKIAQEALQNSLKHAKATDIGLSLTYGTDRFRLSVHDNGTGFDPSLFGKGKTDGSGFGLLAIADRAQSIGGTLQIETQPGHGTVVTLEYPIISKRSR